MPIQLSTTTQMWLMMALGCLYFFVKDLRTAKAPVRIRRGATTWADPTFYRAVPNPVLAETEEFPVAKDMSLSGSVPTAATQPSTPTREVLCPDGSIFCMGPRRHVIAASEALEAPEAARPSSSGPEQEYFPFRVYLQLSRRPFHPDITPIMLAFTNFYYSMVPRGDPRRLNITFASDLKSYTRDDPDGGQELGEKTLDGVKLACQNAPAQLDPHFRWVENNQVHQTAFRDFTRECHESDNCRFTVFLEDDWLFVERFTKELNLTLPFITSLMDHHPSVKMLRFNKNWNWAINWDLPCIYCNETYDGLPVCATTCMSNNPAVFNASWYTWLTKQGVSGEDQGTRYCKRKVFGVDSVMYGNRSAPQNDQECQSPTWDQCGVYLAGPRSHGRTIFHINGKTFDPSAFWKNRETYGKGVHPSYFAEFVDFDSKVIYWP